MVFGRKRSAQEYPCKGGFPAICAKLVSLPHEMTDEDGVIVKSIIVPVAVLNLVWAYNRRAYLTAALKKRTMKGSFAQDSLIIQRIKWTTCKADITQLGKRPYSHYSSFPSREVAPNSRDIGSKSYDN
ncbi:unnamed protein product [Enterobius vermicularis]|uniref:Transmembrane protein n=1 Tax=Enterobius vermicularis TaxID=51028 RepID=A0A0N4UUZ7_ENTVE|nr:unnamed protein product [Enterobius vermicularis]